MQELLNHPAVQAGFAPFLVALIIGELFLRIRLSGLAIIAGFALTVYLVSDFGIEPLTATRKIIWVGVVQFSIGLVVRLIHLKLARLVACRIGRRGSGLDGATYYPTARVRHHAAMGCGLRRLCCRFSVGHG